MLWVTLLFYILYWGLFFTKIRRTALHWTESIFKFIVPIPFWICYLFVIIYTYYPAITQLYAPIQATQKLILENNNRTNEAFIVYTRDSNYVWKAAYPLNETVWSPKFSIEDKKQKTKVYAIDTLNKSARIYIGLITKKPIKYDTTAYAKAYQSPSISIKLFATDFENSVLTKPEIDYSFEWYLIYFHFVALLGIWYQSIIPLSLKKRIAMYVLAVLVTVNLLVALFFYLQSITGIYFIPFMK